MPTPQPRTALAVLVTGLCFLAAAAALPSPPDAHVPPPHHHATLTEQLLQLNEALAANLLTSTEHANMRAQLLESFVSPRASPAPRRSSTAPPQPPYNNLVWSDDFNGPLDMTKWKHEITMGGGGNWEFEYYLNNRSNSFTKNGSLYIMPTLTADTLGEAAMLNNGDLSLWGGSPADLCTSNAFYGCERSSNGNNIINPVQSARLRTAESFSFTYGRVEVRAKLPKGDWLWPAIWMLPRHEAYGTWPASGEIDIMESRGNAAGYPGGGVDTIGSTLHWGPFFPQDPFQMTHATKALQGTDFSEDFHVFGLQWSSDKLVTYLDDPSNTVLEVPFNQSFFERGGWSSNPALNNPWQAANNTNAAPFDQDFYLILNVACGGTSGYWPDGQGGKPWSNTSPTAMKEFWGAKSSWLPSWTSPAMIVDFVKVYQ